MSAKILVVDDSATDRLIIKNMLSDYRILTAPDGLEAMRLIDANSDIDLVILDVKMPNMDGFEVLNALKADARYQGLRILILTNYDELDNEIRGLQLGAVDYIRKPIHMDALKVRIEMHLALLRAHRLLESNLYEHSLTLDTIFQQAPIGIAVAHVADPFSVSPDDIISVNPMFLHITGRTKGEVAKLGWAHIIHPDEGEDLSGFNRLQSGQTRRYTQEKSYTRPDDSRVWAYVIVAELNLSNAHRYNHICLVQDISERKDIEKALSESERSKSVLLSHLPGMAYRSLCDHSWTMQFVSDGCRELTGYAPESLLDNRKLAFNEIITPEYRQSLWTEWQRILPLHLPFKYEYEIITATGERKWVLEMGQGIYNELDEVEALEGIILDISERKAVEDSLRYTNEHDTCTGLYNHRYLESLLLRDARINSGSKRAIIGINLSAVHLLSITYGFHYSQELTKGVSDALKVLCSDRYRLFSAFENQLVFYIDVYQDKETLKAFCEAIIAVLEPILAVERIGVGIGVVEIDEDNKCHAELLLKNLLIASEKAISTFDGDFGYCFFDAYMEEQILREDGITRALNRISKNKTDGELFLQFQPILDVNSNRICGFEALARLQNAQLGLIPPMEFIPIAEKTKLIIPLGEIIIFKALKFLHLLKQSGFDDINVYINISAIQLLRNGFVKNLMDMIGELQVEPTRIGLEITESIFASNYQEINNILGELKGFGIEIAIDDFGTGYSSLAREGELNVNCLKIDKYFIDKLLLEDDAVITGDIISMAHKLKHCVVAEGIEDERQIQYLKKYHCDKIQGYFIAKPLDEEAALAMLKEINAPAYC